MRDGMDAVDVGGVDVEKIRMRVSGSGTWRRSPEILKMIGVSEKELATPIQSMLAAGLKRLWTVREAIKMPQEFTGNLDGLDEEERQAFCKTEGGRIQNAETCAAGLHLPLWRAISGLEPEIEVEQSPEEREQCIRLLLSAVIQLLRFEMEEAEKQTDAWRSFMWDPLPKVCVYLQLSRAQLSRFTREVMGLSAHELVDGLRVQKLRERLKEDFEKMGFVAWVRRTAPKISPQKAQRTDEGSEEMESAARSFWGQDADSPRTLAFDAWRRLKVMRKGPQFDRNSWAIGLGFPNYARMRRACLVIFGKTPAQMEFEVIEELCGELLAREKEVSEKKVVNGGGTEVGSGVCMVQKITGEVGRVVKVEGSGLEGENKEAG